ncbi:MAG TPA: hypothetical protein VK820_10780 [Steroidobacteraceae bacterium]|nr:hypothetical protein [Steroidobacteraceae bacterium]
MRIVNLLLILSLLTATAEAGVVLQVGSRESSSGKTTPHQVYYAQDGMMRIDMLDSRGNVTQLDLVRDGVIWQVDTQNRTYTRIDQATVKTVFGAQNGRIDAMLANLPPEQRALMQARIAQTQQPHQATFTDAGRSEQSGTYSCRMWQEQHSGRPYAEYCVVPTTSLPGGSELAASMHAAITTTNQLVAGIPQMASRAEYLTRLDKLNGFPVLQRFVSPSGKTEREDVLTSAETRALPADKFAIPQGFTEKPLGMPQSN